MARLIVVENLAGPSVAGRGGQAIHVLQALEGLRRLGHEILFLEFLTQRPARDAPAAFLATLGACRGALLDAGTGEGFAGVPPAAVADYAAKADAVISLSAHYRRDPWPLIEAVRPRILIDADPGYTHLWASAGDPLEIFGAHDAYFTVGMNVATPRSPIPTCGISWRTCWQPVVPDWWAGPAVLERDRFTTVAGWRDYGYLELDGRVFGPKAEEFARFIDLPRASGEELELTMTVYEDDPGRQLLLDHGWRLRSPSLVSSPASFHAYVVGSLGEFSCAKGGYVGTRSGWFSDRSACYLAAGRPVVLQSTGFEDVLPVGEGVFAVRDVDEAAAAIAEIRGDYARHAAAARELAANFFDAERVMGKVLEETGVAARPRTAGSRRRTRRSPSRR